MAKKTYSQDEIDKEAIILVDGERQNWEDSVCWVTDKVGFKMRDLIRTVRKNYWGVFDSPTDSRTEREKIWVGLTMSTVEDIVKNIDLDAKDVNFKARYPEGEHVTEIVRGLAQEKMDKMMFGELLDADERVLAIDGTFVWKTWKQGKFLRRASVDLLNFYIDPQARSIQDALRVTERSISTPSAISKMNGWKNTDVTSGSVSLNANDGSTGAAMSQNKTVEEVDVWEMWGLMPEYLVTGKKADTSMIEGHIVVSGLQSGALNVHLIERNNTKDYNGKIVKPYEECRYAVVQGRWYGVGPAERLLALQEYLNTVVNIRINRSYVSQLGLFKIRKGQGITAQMLSRLPSNGAISVNQMDDIEQFQIAGPDATSYKDEEVIRSWAQRITQSFDVTAGETLPASATATSTAISNANAKTGFSMAKDAIGFFVERWIDKHALPIWAESISIGDVVRISGDALDEVIERVVANRSIQIMQEMEKDLFVPSQQAVEEANKQAADLLKKKGSLFVELLQEIIAKNVETRVYMTNEKLDVPVTVQNLLTLLQVAPEYKDDTVKEIYDLLGLRRPSSKQMEQPQMGSAMKSPMESAQQLVTRASTMNG